MTTTTRNPFAEWLLARMAERGWSNAELARQIGVGRAAVSSWLTGWVFPRREQQAALARALNVPVETVAAQIRQAEQVRARRYEATAPAETRPARPRHEHVRDALAALREMFDETVAVPVGDISAGPGIYGDEVFYISRTLLPSDNVVAYRVRGTSLEPNIPDGAFVMVDREASPQIGDLVAAWTPHGLVLKWLVQRDRRLFLEGTNGEVIPVTEDVRIEGVVCGAYNPLPFRRPRR